MEFSPEFLETYREVFTDERGKAIPKAQREKNKELAFSDWLADQDHRRREAARVALEASKETARQNREAAWLARAEAKAALSRPPDDGPEEDPIADPADSHAEALEKIVNCSLKSMTPSDAIKHRSQLLKLAGDTVLLDRKAKIEKASQASGLGIITELFRQVAEGKVKQGPGWIDAVSLPTLSAMEQAREAVEVGESLETPPEPLSAQRRAI